jgi:hypothetical protein
MKPGDDALQDFEKLLPVLVIQEDVLPGVAPGGDMVERPRKCEPQRSAMPPTLFHGHAQNKI